MRTWIARQHRPSWSDPREQMIALPDSLLFPCLAAFDMATWARRHAFSQGHVAAPAVVQAPTSDKGPQLIYRPTVAALERH